MKKTAIQITLMDQVATAAADLFPDDSVLITGINEQAIVKVKENIPRGHKIALVDIELGDKIYKYGEVIGEATEDIPCGHWVHVHNCWGIKARRQYNEK